MPTFQTNILQLAITIQTARQLKNPTIKRQMKKGYGRRAIQKDTTDGEASNDETNR